MGDTAVQMTQHRLGKLRQQRKQSKKALYMELPSNATTKACSERSSPSSGAATTKFGRREDLGKGLGGGAQQPPAGAMVVGLRWEETGSAQNQHTICLDL